METLFDSVMDHFGDAVFVGNLEGLRVLEPIAWILGRVEGCDVSVWLAIKMRESDFCIEAHFEDTPIHRIELFKTTLLRYSFGSLEVDQVAISIHAEKFREDITEKILANKHISALV